MENRLNIPVPLLALIDGVTQEDKLIWKMDCQTKRVEGLCRQIRTIINLKRNGRINQSERCVQLILR